MLASFAALALTVSITNTEAVHGLAPLGERVVACTEGGLDVFAASGAWLRTLHVEDGLPAHGCWAVRAVGGEVFVATERGLAVLSPSLTIERLSRVAWHAVPPGRTRAEVLAHLAALERQLPEGVTWTAFSERFAGSADGRVFRVADGSVVRAVPGAVLSLVEDGEVLHIDAGEGRFVLREGRLEELRRDGVPAEAALERAGVRWLGTRGDGVHREGRRVTPRGQLCGNHVTALARAGAMLVVGTFDRGVCWTEGGRWVRAHKPALPSDEVTAVAIDGRQLFVATTAGLAHFDGRAWTQFAFGGRNPLGLERLSVLGLQRTAEGLWVMDGRGASLVSTDAKQGPRLRSRVRTPEGWAAHPSLSRRAGSALWFASEDRGLIRFDGADWTRFHDGRELTDNWVTALAVEPARAVVGSCTNGFTWFDGARWTRVTTGLPSLMVTAVALTPRGALVGTLGGVAHFDAETGAVTALTEPVADERTSALSWSEGELLIGTEAGLTRLRAAR
ncbi:MAG: hypothetical protein ACOZQL_14260 [Myxococcota bacterium]